MSSREKNILETIMASRRAQVATQKAVMPLEAIKDMASVMPAVGSSFYDCLAAKDSVRIIAEIKRASPSKGDICPELEPEKTALSYVRGGAAAISVLTESEFFKGSARDFADVRGAVDVPLLRKDFIFDQYQVYESKMMGANALLLIVRVLEGPLLKDLIQLTESLGMDSLVEVHQAAETEKALNAGAKIVGINNRDLKTFDTDIKVAAQVSKELPGDCIAVAASGIFARTDIDFYLERGVNCFLVGESIVRSAVPAAFIRELRGVK
ncbi:Indole-3-glycerol phosphate synthase [Limihaloglobus sulfuriphilus]|uniref:Indole-3-glycerol phosphate synthase n=1 Tax=Limihaloglobus sulfuriphilus TaxID=1851148 RepID=A0A1Q2MDQ5_9BACT|nr:indole-3-glycerol phosphate synthase TrpC [Limihaloglobus sulfuriphilus]AQQ70774.1 Indole-3-glycerol phosphate synthase [Limihaloglobus sulfuriphilus]